MFALFSASFFHQPVPPACVFPEFTQTSKLLAVFLAFQYCCQIL